MKTKTWQLVEDENVQMIFSCTYEKCQRKNIKICVKPNHIPACDICGREKGLTYLKTEVNM